MSHQVWVTILKHNLSPNQIYFLDCCRSKIRPSDKVINVEAERTIAIRQGYLSEEGVITDKALVVLDEFETFLVKTKKKVATDVLGDKFLDRIKEYREIFPKGFLPHGEIARQSVEELKNKFIWFFKTYPDYDWDLVLEAASYYNFLKAKEGYKYMATSSYFIQKTDTKSKAHKSTLADYCSLIKEDPGILTREV